jgi:hypothetical protein
LSFSPIFEESSSHDGVTIGNRFRRVPDRRTVVDVQALRNRRSRDSS